MSIERLRPGEAVHGNAEAARNAGACARRALMKSGPGDSVVLRAQGGTEELEILDVRYERIPIESFAEPPGARAATIRPRTKR